jgi:hypothetical protein
MSVYRQMALQAHCVSCGVEQPSNRMEYAPGGGLWCWRCMITAQIEKHALTPAERRAAAWRRAWIIGLAVAGGLWLVYLLLAFGCFAHGC